MFPYFSLVLWGSFFLFRKLSVGPNGELLQQRAIMWDYCQCWIVTYDVILLGPALQSAKSSIFHMFTKALDPSSHESSWLLYYWLSTYGQFCGQVDLLGLTYYTVKKIHFHHDLVLPPNRWLNGRQLINPTFRFYCWIILYNGHWQKGTKEWTEEGGQ